MGCSGGKERGSAWGGWWAAQGGLQQGREGMGQLGCYNMIAVLWLLLKVPFAGRYPLQVGERAQSWGWGLAPC